MSQSVIDDSAKVVVNVEGYEPTPELLLSRQKIQEKISELGAELAKLYKEKGGVHVVTILQGAMHFSSDLQRAMQHAEPELKMTMDTIRVQSYAGTDSTGKVRTLNNVHAPVEGRNVLIVEDIFDTGNTLKWLVGYFGGLKPASLAVVTLLDKQVADRPGPAELFGKTPFYAGFKIPDDFVIGYGLDYNQLYRNLHSIYRLKKKD